MKKIFSVLFVAALLLTAFTTSSNAQVSAERLLGSWKTGAMEKDRDNDSGLDIEIGAVDTLIFSASGKVIDKCGMTLTFSKSDESLSMYIVCSVSGTWTLEGQTLTIKYDKKSLHTEVVECNFPKIIVGAIKSAMNKEMKESVKEPAIYRIEELTTSTLKMAQMAPEESTADTYTRIQ